MAVRRRGNKWTVKVYDPSAPGKQLWIGSFDTEAEAVDAERAAMTKDPAAAKQLLKDFAAPPKLAAAEFAAWYAVCAALLNLDETITKG